MRQFFFRTIMAWDHDADATAAKYDLGTALDFVATMSAHRPDVDRNQLFGTSLILSRHLWPVDRRNQSSKVSM